MQLEYKQHPKNVFFKKFTQYVHPQAKYVHCVNFIWKFSHKNNEKFHMKLT